MSIPVVCPNGHRLNVKDSFAGKTGLCPVCKARVHVPELPEEDLSEDSILDILGPHADGRPGDSSIFTEVPTSGSSLLSSSSAMRQRGAPPKKNCHHCHQEIAAGVRICPHCHTYIGELADF